MSGGAFQPAALLAIRERSFGQCQRCGRAPGVHAHHRLPRRSGGTSRADLGSPANGLWLCLPCHDWVERHRSCAYDLGLLLRAGHDPAATPAFLLLPYGRGWYRVDDEGVVSWAHDLPDPDPVCLGQAP